MPSGPVAGSSRIAIHAYQLKNPRETRVALLYVLQNWAKHGRGAGYDPRSSAVWFNGWTRPPPPTAEKPIVAIGRTWLVRLGWRHHGLLRPDERPAGRLQGLGSGLSPPAPVHIAPTFAF